MKKVLAFIILFFVAMPAFGQVLQGGVQETWTVDRARSAAFENVPYQKNMSWAPAKDPYYDENMDAKRKNLTRVGNRTITYFSTGNYAVHEDSSVNTFYFIGTGDLYAVEYDIGKAYPLKSYKYNYPEGELFTVSIEVEPLNSYIFEPSGAQIYHWVGKKCYDRNGKLHMTRYSIKY